MSGTDIVVQTEVRPQQSVQVRVGPGLQDCAHLTDVNQVAIQHSGMPAISPGAPADVLCPIQHCDQLEVLVNVDSAG